MDKVSLISRLTRAKSSDVLHSSGYARVQNGENPGAGSTQTFSERQELNTSRQYVRGYNESQLGANTVNRRITADNTPFVKYNNIKSDNVNTNSTPANSQKYLPKNNSTLAGTPNHNSRITTSRPGLRNSRATQSAGSAQARPGGYQQGRSTPAGDLKMG